MDYRTDKEFFDVYNPISLNVIREALAISGVPKPMHIKTLDRVKFPTKTVVSAYRMVFAGDRVTRYCVDADTVDGEPRFAWFCRHLNDCFCEDIFTTDWDYNDYDDTVSVTVCTRFVQNSAA